MDANEEKPKAKQLIIHASVQQEDIDRLEWLSDYFGLNRSAVIRNCIRIAYTEAHYIAFGGDLSGED